ncbi:hypothetical protein SteCoe_27725 [Stentor coeruleus]|uniref:NWD2 C-terminal beta-propeller domain-containing protein n=1 Tax=Stentor coeruleus TaxID=5963 RepID=A0A1R2B9U0_9CILI|nr:hypothetical protein SteCoe_27725 [Stentor coeruleus]
MLKCCTNNCKDKPIKQCNSCNGIFFCDECAKDHFEKHKAVKLQCNFGDIEVKLSVSDSIKLKQSIEESIIAIKNQKNSILSQALAVHDEIENMVKFAIDYLDDMINEYIEISEKKLFKYEEFIRAKAIIKEFLVFDSPKFSDIKGDLIKNSKMLKKGTRRASKSTIEYDYGLNIEGHEFGITSVAISSDNKFLVTGAFDKTVRVWNILKNQQEIVFEGHKNYVTSVAITNNSCFIVSGSNGTVRVWNINKKCQETVFYTDDVTSVAISKDDQFIIYSSNASLDSSQYSVIVRSFLDDKYEVKFMGHTDSIKCVAITSDNQFVVSGSGSYSKMCDNNIRLWNLKEKREEGVLQGHTRTVTCLAITNDDQYIVSGSDDFTIRMWDILKKQQITIIEGYTNVIPTIAITSDNQFIILGFGNGAIEMWNLQEKRQETEFLGHTDIVYNIAISKNNKFLVSVSTDLTIRIWSLIEKKEKQILEAHEGDVNCVSITNDYKYAISGSGTYWSNKKSKVRIWNLISKKQEAMLEGHENGVMSVAISRDYKFIITGSHDKTVRLWNFQNKKQEAVFLGHKDSVNSVAISNDNFLAVSGSNDMTVRVWNLVIKKKEAVLKGHNKSVKSVAIMNNNQLMSISEFEFIIWDLVNRSPLFLFKRLGFCFSSLDESIFVFRKNIYWATLFHLWNLNDKRKKNFIESEFGYDYIFDAYVFNAYITSFSMTSSNRFIVLNNLLSVSVMKLPNSKQNPLMCNSKKILCNTKKAIHYNPCTSNSEILYTEDKQFKVFTSSNSVEVLNFESNKLKAYLYVSDNIKLQGILLSRLENKIFLSTGLGISTFSIDKNELEHELFFNSKLEELFNNEPSFEDFLPQLGYIDRD